MELERDLERGVNDWRLASEERGMGWDGAWGSLQGRNLGMGWE